MLKLVQGGQSLLPEGSLLGARPRLLPSTMLLKDGLLVPSDGGLVQIHRP